MEMSKLTQQETASTWLFSDEYVNQNLGAAGFYKKLGQHEKRQIDEMIADISKCAPAPAVEWRKIAEQLYEELNNFSTAWNLISVRVALAAYELAAEAEAEKADAIPHDKAA